MLLDFVICDEETCSWFFPRNSHKMLRRTRCFERSLHNRHCETQCSPNGRNQRQLTTNQILSRLFFAQCTLESREGKCQGRLRNPFKMVQKLKVRNGQGTNGWHISKHVILMKNLEVRCLFPSLATSEVTKKSDKWPCEGKQEVAGKILWWSI